MEARTSRNAARAAWALAISSVGLALEAQERDCAALVSHTSHDVTVIAAEIVDAGETSEYSMPRAPC